MVFVYPSSLLHWLIQLVVSSCNNGIGVVISFPEKRNSTWKLYNILVIYVHIHSNLIYFLYFITRWSLCINAYKCGIFEFFQWPHTYSLSFTFLSHFISVFFYCCTIHKEPKHELLYHNYKFLFYFKRPLSTVITKDSFSFSPYQPPIPPMNDISINISLLNEIFMRQFAWVREVLGSSCKKNLNIYV